MKFTKLMVLLAYFCISYLYAAEMVIREGITESIGDIDAIRHSVQDANGKDCALLKIQTDLIPFDKIESPLFPVQIMNKSGEVWIYLSSGEKRIYFSKDGYAKLVYDLPLRMESSKVYSMKIVAGGETKANTLTVTVKVTPSNAKVAIGDSTNVDITKPLLLKPGIHRIKISLEGYKTIDSDIEVSDTKAFFEYTLQTIDQVKVTITSVPEEADIYIDNIIEGKTNKQIFKYPGKYNLRLLKPGFDLLDESIIVKESDQNVFHYNLVKASAGLILTLNPSDAQIFVDNIEYHTNKIEIAPGLHKLEIRKDGYEPVVKQVTLQKGKEEKEHIDMVQHIGKLIITVEPMVTTVVLSNGMKWEGSNMLNLPVGSYTLSATALNYVQQNYNFTISKDKETILDFKLDKAVSQQTSPIIKSATTKNSFSGENEGEKQFSKIEKSILKPKRSRLYFHQEVKAVISSSVGESWAETDDHTTIWNDPVPSGNGSMTVPLSAELFLDVYKKMFLFGVGYEYETNQSFDVKIAWKDVFSEPVTAKVEEVTTHSIYAVPMLMLAPSKNINFGFKFRVGYDFGGKTSNLGAYSDTLSFGDFSATDPGGVMISFSGLVILKSGYTIGMGIKTTTPVVVNYKQYSNPPRYFTMAVRNDDFYITIGKIF